MSEIIEYIILGIVQGLTEFLPVSSSGHLELGKAIFDLDLAGDESLLLTVMLHFGTALSTVVVFWKDILWIVRGLFEFRWNEQTQLVFKIGISMFPAVLAFLLFEEKIELLFSENVLLVGLMLFVTGSLLFLADKASQTKKSVGFLHAVIIGISQAIAMIPGISRSGATISTSVLLGIDRDRAARFSFLMVVPLIFGKVAKDTKDYFDGDLEASTDSFLALGLGFAAAFVTGLFACRWMISLVKRCQLRWFSWYCFVIGALAIGWHLLRGSGQA